MYWQEEVMELDSEAPQYYQIVDNTLAFIDYQGYLKVFYKGKVTTLEAYAPPEHLIKITEGIVVYPDLDGRLKAFYEGQHVKISQNIVDDFRLVNRVILYEIRNRATKIYWNGQHYD